MDVTHVVVAVSPWILGGAAALAGAVAAVSGFGIGSILTPVLLLTMPTSEAIAIVAIPHAWATIIRFWRLRADIDGATLRQFGIASAIGGLAGALLQPYLASGALTVLLAVLLLLAGTGELIGRTLPLPGTPAWRTLGGVVSGCFGGLVGNQGGIRAAALLGFSLSPRALVATATASALVVDVARVPVYAWHSADVIARSGSMLIVTVVGVTIGTLLGVPLLGRIPVRIYRRVVGALLVAVGVALMVAR